MDVDASAFDLGSDGRAAALCLHGLTGTPYEVRPLAEALARGRIRAVGPALPGHNETPQALARSTHDEWLAAARRHLADLRRDHERVFAVGMSMGGLLSLDLAAEESVDALVVVGTPLRLPALVEWLVPLFKYLRPFQDKSEGSDIRDEDARRRHPGYRVMPLASVHELVRLQRRVRRRLARIRVPILVAHGAHDRTARPLDAQTIVGEVASTDTELLLLQSSGHICPVDFDGPALARASAEFLGRQV